MTPEAECDPGVRYREANWEGSRDGLRDECTAALVSYSTRLLAALEINSNRLPVVLAAVSTSTISRTILRTAI